MEPFKRKDQNDVEQNFIGANGVLDSISETTKRNSNDKEYHQFSATVTNASGNPMKIAGQLYTGLIPFLTAMPKAGDKLSFNSAVVDLKEGYNTRWSIGGSAVDAVSDELKSLIDGL